MEIVKSKDQEEAKWREIVRLVRIKQRRKFA